MDNQWAKAAKNGVRCATISILLTTTPILASDLTVKEANLIKEVMESEVQVTQHLASESELALLEHRIEDLIYSPAPGSLHKEAKASLSRDYVGRMNRILTKTEADLKHLDILASYIEHPPEAIKSQRQTLSALLSAWKDQAELLRLAIDKKLGTAALAAHDLSRVNILKHYYAYSLEQKDRFHFSAFKSWSDLQKACAELQSVAGDPRPSECQSKLQLDEDQALQMLTEKIKTTKNMLMKTCNSKKHRSPDCDKLNLILSSDRLEIAQLSLEQKVDLESWLTEITSRSSSLGGVK